MRPLNLQEFAEELRRQGNEFADDILMLIDIEQEVAEPYSTLCDDVAHYAPEALKEHPVRAVEWLGDRSNELDEIRGCFSEEAMSESSVADLIKELQDERENIETVMREHGGWTEGDLQDALFALIDRTPAAMEYDL
jgi:hypothetical protein